VAVRPGRAGDAVRAAQPARAARGLKARLPQPRRPGRRPGGAPARGRAALRLDVAERRGGRLRAGGAPRARVPWLGGRARARPHAGRAAGRVAHGARTRDGAPRGENVRALHERRSTRGAGAVGRARVHRAQHSRTALAASVGRRVERRGRPRSVAGVARGMTTAPGQTATAPSPRRALASYGERLAPHHIALAGGLAVWAVLDLTRLSQNGYGNIFYSAGVKSMLRSLHNFFFVSFAPGGLMMVDKPPLGLWLQAASAKLFGFTPLSLLLPEAIMGMLAALLLYRLLARRIGGWAGVAGALALALCPSFVAISRTSTVDALLILLMILACDAALRAIETGRWRTLLWSGALVGLAFNTKTLAAYLVVPGIALGYLVCAPGSVPRRLTQLLAAGLLMLVVSFSWMAVGELTPASQRPYVGSSTDNTEFGLTFSYNGFGRVNGQVGGPGQIPAGTGGRAHTPTGRGGPSRQTRKPPAAKPPAILSNGRARNPIPFGGPVGPFRLFGKGLGDQGAWLLPFALIGLLAVALLTLSDQRSPGGRDRRDVRLAVLFVLGGWFLVEAAVVSASKGIVHPYYVSALGPGVAAMVGAGTYAFAQLAKRRSWLLLLLPCAAA